VEVLEESIRRTSINNVVAEDYEVPGSNPGENFEMRECVFSIGKTISNSLHGAARSGTGSHPFTRYIYERHMLVM
jgi:hypothetical protein